jgi:hypothetical protein
MMSNDAISPRHRLNRRIMLLVVAAFAVVCALAVVLEIPELIPATAIPVLAWFAWRVYHVSALGTVLCVATLEQVTGIVAIIYRSAGNVFEFIPIALLFFSALGSMLTSVAVFLVCQRESPAQRRHNFLAAGLACVLPILWFAIGPRGAGILAEWKLQREIIRSGLPELIADLNAVTERLGRVPRDEEELTRLLGKRLPHLPRRGRVWYCPGEGKNFTLRFGFDIGQYKFDSRKPEEGWHIDFGGDE